jgi:hypothetical protein
MERVLKRMVPAVLFAAASAWSFPAAAFFCFSMGGGSRNHAGNFAPPVAPGIGAGWYPASPYMIPAPPVVVLPVFKQVESLPARRDNDPQQHIFK